MKSFIKKHLPVELVRNIVVFKYKYFPNLVIKDWEKQGKPVPPPPVVKQKLIKEIRQEYNYEVLVETGTYLGYMISAQKKNFKRIFSIEISDVLYERASRKFKNNKHIKLIHGDSGEKLAEVMKELKEPAIFWLDGHYSGGITEKGELNCPIWNELDSIFENGNKHIILIDDARDFNGTNDYPTYEEVKAYLLKKNPAYKVTVVNDIIVAKL